MKLLIVILLGNLVTRFAHVDCSTSNDEKTACTTPNGENATCIPIRECQIFLDAIKLGVRQNPSIVDFMRKSSCGFQDGPLVCCGSVNHFQEANLPAMDMDANCTTPNGENAICMPLKECQIFFDAIKVGVRLRPSIVDFMRQSRCGFKDGPLVCCGSVNHFQEVTLSADDVKKHRNFHLLPKNCGIQNADENIIGGTEAQLEEFPWMALVEYKNKTGHNKGYRCAASLISEQYVLTAAHCMTGYALTVGNPWRIRIGDHDFNTELDCRLKSEGNQQYYLCNGDYQDVEIERLIPHPDFDWNGQYHNDIALIKLRKPVNIRINVRPICLPLNGETTAPGKRLFAAGWGSNGSARSSKVKLKVSLPVVSNEQCNTKYNPFNRTIIESQICAGGEPEVDTCRGDNGGPMMMPIPGSNPSQWYIEGIISFGPNPCGKPDFPGVDTKVGSYIGWILDNME